MLSVKVSLQLLISQNYVIQATAITCVDTCNQQIKLCIMIQYMGLKSVLLICATGETFKKYGTGGEGTTSNPEQPIRIYHCLCHKNWELSWTAQVEAPTLIMAHVGCTPTSRLQISWSSCLNTLICLRASSKPYAAFCARTAASGMQPCDTVLAGCI